MTAYKMFHWQITTKEVLMPPENRFSTHPGEILLAEFLNLLGLSRVAFAIC
jgi:hypothetical protein